MKRIGKLNNKIVVQGDPNLVKSNQILYKEDSSGIVLQERKNNNLENITAGGGGSDKIEYFKFKEPIITIDEMFKFLMSTVAFENGPMKGIIPYGKFGAGFIYNTILGFAFCGYAINTGAEYVKSTSVKQYLIAIQNSDITYIPNPDDIPDTIYEDFGLIPITKEEYYDLIK